jgi:hypothetical protein
MWHKKNIYGGSILTFYTAGIDNLINTILGSMKRCDVFACEESTKKIGVFIVENKGVAWWIMFVNETSE